MARGPRLFVRALLALSLSGAIPLAFPQRGAQNGEWRTYGGDLGNTRYSPLDQIGGANFNNLEVAWRFKTDSLGPRPEYQYEGTPLMVKGRMYITAGSRRAVVCLDAATGEMLWMHSENEGARGEHAPRQLSGHGVAYWTDGTAERILYVTAGYRLISLDAKTGIPVSTFGVNGVIDLKKDDDQEMDLTTAAIGLHATPKVAKNVVIVGAAMLDGHSPKSKTNVKGYIRGFDVRTGKRLWIFHTIPRPGEYGIDTWEKDSWSYTGNTGAWAEISVDEDLNMAYLPVELPTGDVYGGHRPGAGLFGESIVAVDLTTGKRIWHYQLVHHGLWDMDIPCAPMLVDFRLNGQLIKAVAQPTKQAYLYVFDRKTGKPVWPIVERPVPKGDVPDEWYSPTQPIPTKPPAYGHQGISVDDLMDFTPELRARAIQFLKDSKFAIGPLFTPPVVSKIEGPIGVAMSPGAQGGTNWPGGAYDPETHLLYVYSKTTAQVSSLVKPAPGASDMNYITGRAGQAPSAPRPMGARPATGASGRSVYVMVDGLPLLKPPYGILTAIDLDRGDLAWEIAHGETPDSVRNNPALKGVKIPRTGQSGNIGPLCTKTLVIIGDPEVATTPSGERGAPLRAYDKATGKEVGAVFMPAPQSGSPMTYMLNGQQYIAVAISGGNYSGELVAFKLPSEGKEPSRPAQTQAAAARPAASGVSGAAAPFYTAAQAERGRALYSQQCAVCHGADLEGIEMAPGLAGGGFIDRWTGQSLGDLYERIRTTMPRGKPGSLSREANADITAYILSANQFEGGSAEMPSDAPSLKGIRIASPAKH
ncbi:MAG: PQQ-binding-like beta-propeller repeat protein [Acidobacteriota bacterium]|nr:PQQ-binding-like beta-propeller repeat protein [Acidobacteriota bacterium]